MFCGHILPEDEAPNPFDLVVTPVVELLTVEHSRLDLQGGQGER